MQDKVDDAASEADGMHIFGPEYYVNVALVTAPDGTVQLIYGAAEGAE